MQVISSENLSALPKYGIEGHEKPLQFWMPMKAATSGRAAASVHFRTEIEKAESQGVAREDMTLHLTLNDVNQLRRDQSLPVADLSFAGGVMRYLGVKVEQGGVPESMLNHKDD
jgi:hypothetical protein